MAENQTLGQITTPPPPPHSSGPQGTGNLQFCCCGATVLDHCPMLPRVINSHQRKKKLNYCNPISMKCPTTSLLTHSNNLRGQLESLGRDEESLVGINYHCTITTTCMTAGTSDPPPQSATVTSHLPSFAASSP